MTSSKMLDKTGRVILPGDSVQILEGNPDLLPAFIGDVISNKKGYITVLVPNGVTFLDDAADASGTWDFFIEDQQYILCVDDFAVTSEPDERTYNDLI